LLKGIKLLILTKIIFILSAYLITFLIIFLIFICVLKSHAPENDDESTDHGMAGSYYYGLDLKIPSIGDKTWRGCLIPLLIILSILFVSAILTYFIYKLYPFEPTIPNFVTIIGSFFGVFIAFYFLRKSLE